MKGVWYETLHVKWIPIMFVKTGCQFVKPDGEFYVFVRMPPHYESDVILKENILSVAGSDFCYLGLHLSFCIKTEIIEKAFTSQSFKRLNEKIEKEK